MRGNLHVRFLGEGVAARRPPYPTAYDGSIPFARSIPKFHFASLLDAIRGPGNALFAPALEVSPLSRCRFGATVGIVEQRPELTNAGLVLSG